MGEGGIFGLNAAPTMRHVHRQVDHGRYPRRWPDRFDNHTLFRSSVILSGLTSHEGGLNACARILVGQKGDGVAGANFHGDHKTDLDAVNGD